MAVDVETLRALAERLLEGRGSDNRLDVEVEVALFQPCQAYAAIRPNAAGTKIICTDHKGRDMTFWAPDWTVNRQRAANEVRARAAIQEGGE